MDFNWEDISKKLTSAADYTVKQTEKLTSMAKLEYRLASAKNKLNLLYQGMGKMKYAEMSGESVSETAYEEICGKIRELTLVIARMEEELAKLRNYRRCIACGAKITNEMAFCPKCGTRQEPVAEEETAEPEEASAASLPAPEKAPESAEDACADATSGAAADGAEDPSEKPAKEAEQAEA